MRLVCGVGNNDADYVVKPTVNDKRVACPFYVSWKNMLMRCYLDKYQQRQPSYKGCSVAEDWMTFSNFRAWMVEQDWEGKQLDKDLLVEGNKVYGPDTCVFVSDDLNKLLTDRAAARGDLPIGVSKHGNNYQAHINNKGKQISLGTFSTPEEAHLVWRKAKAGIILEARELTDDIRVKEALTSRAWSLLC